MKFTAYEDERDSTPVVYDLPWEGLKNLLLSHEIREEKSGAAWTPGEVAVRRASANVQVLTAMVFDLDHATLSSVVACATALEAANLTYVAHSTFSHKGENDNGLRIVLPLAKEFVREGLTEAEFKRRWVAFRQIVVERFKIPADPACSDLARLYYMPACPPTRTDIKIAESFDGQLLDLSTLTGQSSNPRTPALEPEMPCESASPTNEPIDMEAARKKLRGIGKDTDRDLMRRIYEGEPLALEGDRDNTVNRAASIIAWQAPELNAEAAMELLRPSLASMPGDEPPSFWIAKALDCFKRATERREIMQTERAIKAREFRDALEAAIPQRDLKVPGYDDPNWRDKLELTINKDGTTHIKNTTGNLSIYLQHDPIWKGCFSYDEVRQQLKYVPGPVPLIDLDSLPIQISNWFQNAAPDEDRLHLGSVAVHEQILTACFNNRKDPLKEHLMSLKWDGEERVDNWLQRCLHARKTNDDGEDIAPYVEQIGRRWLIGAVARALDPGCKMDTVLVLEGTEGLKKGTALSILGNEWYSDSQIFLGDKDSQMKMTQNWILEMPEMDAVKTVGSSRYNAFISQRDEQFRAPYGRHIKRYPRRAILVGTTNPEDGSYEYLKSGVNRRFWFVRCSKTIDVGLLRRIRDQLFAEAVHLYLQRPTCLQCHESTEDACEAHRHWFTPEEDEKYLVNKVAAAREGNNNYIEELSRWWLSMPPAKRPEHVSISAIATECLLIPIDRISRSVETKIGNALHRCGWRQGSRVTLPTGVRVKPYYPPAGWRDMPQRKQHLTVVEGGLGAS